MNLYWKQGMENPVIKYHIFNKWDIKGVQFVCKMFTQNPSSLEDIGLDAFKFYSESGSSCDKKEPLTLREITFLNDGLTSRVYSASYQKPKKKYKETEDRFTKCVIKLVWKEDYKHLIEEEKTMLNMLWSKCEEPLYIPRVVESNERALLLTPKGERIEGKFQKHHLSSLLYTLEKVHKAGYGKNIYTY